MRWVHQRCLIVCESSQLRSLEWNELFTGQRFLVGRRTYIDSFTSVLINICARNNAPQKVCFEGIDPDSLDVFDCV